MVVYQTIITKIELIDFEMFLLKNYQKHRILKKEIDTSYGFISGKYTLDNNIYITISYREVFKYLNVNADNVNNIQMRYINGKSFLFWEKDTTPFIIVEYDLILEK